MSDIKINDQYLEKETNRVLKIRSQMENVAHNHGLSMTPASITKFVSGRGKQFNVEFTTNGREQEENIFRQIKG